MKYQLEQLNTSKTKVIRCKTLHRKHQLSTTEVQVRTDCVSPSKCVRITLLFLLTDVSNENTGDADGCQTVSRLYNSFVYHKTVSVLSCLSDTGRLTCAVAVGLR